MANKVNAASDGSIDPTPGGRRHAAGKSRRKTGIIVAASTAAVALVAVAATASAASSSIGGATASGASSPQRIGVAPRAPQGALTTGTTNSGTTLHLSVNLAPRDPQALKDFIGAVSTKGNAQYHHYLGKGRFAAAFGPTQATIDQVTNVLKKAGLTPGAVSADGLSIPVTATTEQASHAFNTGFTDLRLKDGRTAYANTAAPSLPASVAKSVTGITGLTSVSTVTSHLSRTKKQGPAITSGGLRSRSVTSNSFNACTAVGNSVNSAVTDGNQYFSRNKLISDYHLGTASNAGAGVTVAVYELENVLPTNISFYQSCMGTHAPVSYVKVDGGPTTPASDDPTSPNFGVGYESMLDIENIVGLAPGASVIDYAGPDNQTEQSDLDVYQQIVGDDKAQVISTSWGQCETYANPQSVSAENYIFQEAAAQGQTVVAASGDTGSSDCYRENGSTALAVDDPASQPYVTGVGGTTMHDTGAGMTQTAWNSQWTGSDGNTYSGAGGGGRSSVWPAQDFQATFASTATREVPDVSALADPVTGYLLYVQYQGTGAKSNTTYYNWTINGGTSGAAPTWAAAIAQAESSAACKASGPIGFANPSLYNAARTKYSATFQDVTTGSNDMLNVGQYPAKVGYDNASGLGTPQGTGLAAALCNVGPAPATGASTYHSMAPQRLLDTRYGTGWGGSSNSVPAYGTAPVKIEGNAGIKASGVTAVVLNVTALHQQSSGWLTAYPAGSPRPNTSNLNWAGWGARSNLVTVPVGGNGWVDLFNGSAGSTAMFADVVGYYTNDTSGATFKTVTPTRLLDTRNSHAIAGGGTTTFTVAGQGGVPPVGTVTSVVLNVTALHQATYGWLGAYAADNITGTSNINWSGWGAIPNLVTVPLSATGQVTIKNGSTGSIDAFADVFGYYTTDGTGYSYTSLPNTQRLLDTRSNVGHTGPLAANASVNLSGIPSGAKAVVLNVTELHANQYGWLTAWPAGTTRTGTSNLNWSGWGTNPNAVIVPTGSGSVSLGNSPQGSIDVFADLFGYFS